MLFINTRLENIAIMSLQSGGSLGIANQAIIDPRKLQVVAYHVSGPRIHEASVLHTADIREVGPLGFIVDSSDDIMTLDGDLVRLQEVIDFKFNILGKEVIDDHKKKLGKVAEYSLESEGFYIQRLHVSQSVMKSLSNSQLVIHRSQIVEVNDRQIVVKSATVPVQQGLVQALNPFHKDQQLNPESAKTDD